MMISEETEIKNPDSGEHKSTLSSISSGKNSPLNNNPLLSSDDSLISFDSSRLVQEENNTTKKTVLKQDNPYRRTISSELTFDSRCVALETTFIDSDAFVFTASGNKISTESILCGPSKIHMIGRSMILQGTVLRGDLAMIRIGRYVCLGQGTTLHPPNRVDEYKDNQIKHIPMTIGDYVSIGTNCVINAVSIGNNTLIGNNCVLGMRSILKDNSIVASGSVVPPDTVVPPYVLFRGVPARFSDELPESTPFIQKKYALNLYQSLKQR